MTMRRGYTPSRPYPLRRTNQVYHDLRGSTILATSPRTRTSFTTIRARFGFLGDPQGDIGQSSSHPPPPPPQPSTEAAPSNPSPDLEDPVLSLTERFDAFWDETQEHRVLITQDMEALRADVCTVLANQATILQQQQSLQAQLAQLLAFHQPPPPPPQ